MAEGSPPPASGRWYAPLAAIGAGFVALAILSIAVVAVPVGQSDSNPTSPQETVTAFAAAVNQRDWAKADSFLSERLRMSGISTAAGFADKGAVYLGQLVPVKVASNAAILQVEFRFLDLKSGLNSVTSFDLELVVERGGWKIDTDFWANY